MKLEFFQFFSFSLLLAAARIFCSQARRGGKQVHLGSFATAEEAALCVARSPDGAARGQRQDDLLVPQ